MSNQIPLVGVLPKDTRITRARARELYLGGRINLRQYERFLDLIQRRELEAGEPGKRSA